MYELPQASDVSLILYDILGREVARLVDSYMEPGYHQVQWEATMLRSAKLESLGVMAGGLAHDFNNFLASIMLNVSTARLKAGKGEEIRDLLQAAKQSIQNARSITQQVLTFTRGGEPVKSSTSLQPIIKESVKFTLPAAVVRRSAIQGRDEGNETGPFMLQSEWKGFLLTI